MSTPATLSTLSRRPVVWWIVAALGLLLTLWNPGDTKWVYDEPQLLYNAYVANLAGRLCSQGLMGSQGVHYGPMPTWIYQALLLVTHDLVLIALLKTLLATGAMLIFLVLLARELNWSRWPVLLALVSPYLYLFNRQIWDNVHLIPQCVCLLWLVAAFAKRPGYWQVVTGFLLSIWMFYTHIISAPMIAGWGVGMLLVGFGWLKQHWKSSSLAALAAICAIVPYVLALVSDHQSYEQFRVPSHLLAGLGGLKGVVFFSAHGLDQTFLPAMYTPAFVLPPVLMNILWGLGWLGVLVLLVGLIPAARQLYNCRREPITSWALKEQLSATCFTVIFCQCLVFFGTRQQAMYHYFNGTWIAYFWFFWLGVRQLVNRPWGQVVVVAHTAALSVVIAAMAIHIHIRAGNRSPAFSPTLSTQIGIARQMVDYQPVSYRTYTGIYEQFPFVLTYLLSIVDDGEPPMKERPPATFIIGYQSDDPTDAHLVVKIIPVAP